MKPKDLRQQIPSAVILGSGLGLVTTVIVTGICAAWIAGETMSQEHMGIAAMIATLLGSIVSAMVAISKIKQMRLIMGLLAAAGYLVGLICCAIILFDGVKHGLGTTALLVLGGTLSAVILTGKSGKKQKIRSFKLKT